MWYKEIDGWRKMHMAFAEWVDAWRIIPRAVLVGYSWLLYRVTYWYMHLTPTMIHGCTSEKITDCIAYAPNTEHAVVLTAIIGVAAAVFGLYANSGRKWDQPFLHWNPENMTEEEKRFWEAKIALREKALVEKEKLTAKK